MMRQQDNFRILIIDDNPDIHNDFIRILTTESSFDKQLGTFEKEIFGEEISNDIRLPAFQIDAVLQGEEGIHRIEEAVRKENNSYALAFVDIRMPPGQDGVETIQRMWEIDPDIQVVICTAYSDYSWEETIAKLGQKDNLLILKKPFDNTVVRQLACALTKKWLLLQQVYAHSSELEMEVEERTEQLKQSLSVTRGTLESTLDGILVVSNSSDEIIDYNAKLVEMWEIPDSVIATNKTSVLLEYLVIKVQNATKFEALAWALKDTEAITGQIKTNDDSTFEYYSQPYKIDEKVLGRIWSFRDNTARVALEEKLQYQATHDLLTDLPNRAFLNDKIREEIAKSRNTNLMFGVLFLDLDRFKLINDSFNHLRGDELLKMTAKRLAQAIRKDDALIRFGGDEFLAIISSIKDKNDLIFIASKLLSVFRDPFKIEEHEFSMTASMGISIFPHDGKDMNELLCNADAAMYQAKGYGGARFEFYNETFTAKNKEVFQLEADLYKAVANHEFFLCYQPQIHLSNPNFISTEALIRWNHPQRGTILPMTFIPIAEKTGLIIPIGEWVLREACLQAKAWQDKGIPLKRIAINISNRQLKQPDFIIRLKKILEETQLKPECLELELLENTLLNDKSSIKMLKALKKIGVYISLDDFGTGNSALNYLRRLSIDRLKIDKSFIQNMDVNKSDQVIVKAIISMAKSFNLKVIAEGVETKKQLEFLESNACDDVQGYFYSKPLSASEFEQFIQDEIIKKKDE